MKLGFGVHQSQIHTTRFTASDETPNLGQKSTDWCLIAIFDENDNISLLPSHRFRTKKKCLIYRSIK